MISIEPSWDISDYPCPRCQQQTLVYDGSVKWRSGPRPPRSVAKRVVGFSPCADFEIAHYFHCAHCGTRFHDPLDNSRGPHLYVEPEEPV